MKKGFQGLVMDERRWRMITFLLIGILCALLATSIYFTARGAFFLPFGEYSEQQVVATEVNGLPQISLSTDKTIVTRAVKCTRFPIDTVGGFSYYGESGDGIIIVVPGTVGYTHRLGKCETLQFVNVFPRDLTPGIWQMRGAETAFGENGESATKTWSTERFRVVE